MFRVPLPVLPLLALLAAGAAHAQTTSMVPAYDHIVVVVEENHGFRQIVDNDEAFYINALASYGALLTNDHAVTHPSEPNYFALYAGSTFGIADDNPHQVPDPSLYTVLHHAGLSFIGYVDAGSTDANHNPWESFPEGTSVEKDFGSSFPKSDFAALPKIAFVIPDLDHDMHDGSIAKGDQWLREHLGAYAQWGQSNNSLLIVTFDENEGLPGNRIATVLNGAHVPPGTIDGAFYTHYNLLSTILAAANLTAPRHAATAGHFQVFAP